MDARRLAAFLVLATTLAAARVVLAGIITIQTEFQQCHGQLPPFMPSTLQVVYWPDQVGPPAIRSATFRIDVPENPALALIFTPNPNAGIPAGDAEAGFQIWFPNCMQSPVYLMTIQAIPFATLQPQRWTVRGVGAPGDPCASVTACTGSDLVPVYGGSFEVNPIVPPYGECGRGGCDTLPVEQRTWAAIKSVYR